MCKNVAHVLAECVHLCWIVHAKFRLVCVGPFGNVWCFGGFVRLILLPAAGMGVCRWGAGQRIAWVAKAAAES